MTADLIAQSQTGSNDATLVLIEKFNPLLRKYAYKLFYDDAYSDLLVDFIELLHNIQLDHLRDISEGSLVPYICTSVRSSYIKRSIAINKLHNLMLYSDLNDDKLYCIEAASAVSDTYFKYELPDVDQILTKSESSNDLPVRLYHQGDRMHVWYYKTSRESNEKKSIEKIREFIFGQAILSEGDKMNEFFNNCKIVLALSGGILGWIFGGFNSLIYALIAFVVIDYFTGVLLAI